MSNADVGRKARRLWPKWQQPTAVKVGGGDGKKDGDMPTAHFPSSSSGGVVGRRGG